MKFIDTDSWREIAATLGRNKTRTFLTAFGIFWGTAMLAMLWGGADGLKGVMRRSFAGLSTNLGVIVSGNRSMPYQGFNRGSSWEITIDDAATIRRVAPEIDLMSTIRFYRVSASAGSHSKSCNALGVQPDYFAINIPTLVAGRFINSSDEAGSRKVCVIGKNMANELFPSEDAVGQPVELNGIRFIVVGVAAQKGKASIGSRIDDSIIMPATTMARAFNLDNIIHFITFTSKKGHTPSESEDRVRRALSRVHYFHQDDTNALYLQDMSDNFRMIDNLFMGLTILAIFVGLASLMAGVIGVGNIMWIVVKERTHEFGVRRAIGAKPRDITSQILGESILLTVVAGTAGVCFAALVLGLADSLTTEPGLPPAGFEISFGRAVGIVVAFIVLGSLAGTLPAIKAMKIKPIEALRTK